MIKANTNVRLILNREKTKRIFLTVQGKIFFHHKFGLDTTDDCLVPPRIIDFRPNPPLFSIPTGTSLTLLCRAEGTPSPRIRWRIRDVETNRIDLRK